MPRKKLDSEPISNDIPTTEPTETEVRPSRSRSRSKSGPETPAPEAAPAEVKPKGRRKNALQLLSEATQKMVETVAHVLQPEPEKKTRARKASAALVEKPVEVAAVIPTTDPADWSADMDLPIPEWRPRQGKSEAVAAVAAPAQEKEEGDLIGRGRKRRRRRNGKDQDVDSPETEVEIAVEEKKPEPVVVIPSRPEPPKIPVRPQIEIPDTAPQVVLRNGIPTLVRDGRVYPPIFFFGSASDEKRAATVIEEARTAGESGVHIHCILIEFEVDQKSVDSSVSLAAYMLTKLVEADPEAQVIFRLNFQAPRGWQHRYNNAKYFLYDDSPAEPSICDDEFWGVAQECLISFVKKLRMLDGDGHVLGVHLDRGEWFHAADWGYDTSNAAKHKFRDWARTRYSNDEVALRASWFDGSARFETLQIPAFQPEGEPGDHFVRSSRKQRRFVDYHLFLSDATVGRIQDLAHAAKGASEGTFLIGVSYGYTFEWSHPASCHLSLGKLLRTPEIDFIAGPPSYRTREPGGAAPFPSPIDSFALNGKLFVSEEDFKTSIGGGHEPDDFNPVIKTPQALESVHWRGAGAALAHGAGVCWMDLWGNGWLKTQQIWNRAAKVRESLIYRMGVELGDPDVVVFIDERALAYLVDQSAFQLLVQNVRESVLRSGLSAGFYLLSDLAHRERFPEGKLYLFVNAWDIRPELRAAIKERLQRDGKTLFWLYSAGLFDAGRDSLERAREVTGIALKPQPFHSKTGTTIHNPRHPLSEAFRDKQIQGAGKMEPSYFAIPENAVVLGDYSATGLPSFVCREFDGDGDPALAWRSVFMGEPVVTPALIRALGQMAGAHVWNFQDDVVHVRLPFVTIHCKGAGARVVALPNKMAAYNLTQGQWLQLEGSSLKFQAVDGSTHVFLIGLREEIESILQQDQTELLKMAELPPKPQDVRLDNASFDVPIMRLDEWIADGDPAEESEEWLLQPKLVEDQPEGESEKVGKRRNRRRNGKRGDRGGSEETAGARSAEGTPVTIEGEDGFEMNVMFRKRE